MTSIIVTQDGVEVAYEQPTTISVTTEGVEVAYSEAVAPGVESFEVMWVD